MLNLVLFKFSVYDSNATYGAQLQNLKYRNEWKHRGPCKTQEDARQCMIVANDGDDALNIVESIAKDSPLTQTQKILYGVLTVGGQYAWTRSNRYITEQGWGELDEVREMGAMYCMISFNIVDAVRYP